MYYDRIKNQISVNERGKNYFGTGTFKSNNGIQKKIYLRKPYSNFEPYSVNHYKKLMNRHD